MSVKIEYWTFWCPPTFERLEHFNVKHGGSSLWVICAVLFSMHKHVMIRIPPVRDEFFFQASLEQHILRHDSLSVSEAWYCLSCQPKKVVFEHIKDLERYVSVSASRGQFQKPLKLLAF